MTKRFVSPIFRQKGIALFLAVIGWCAVASATPIHGHTAKQTVFTTNSVEVRVAGKNHISKQVQASSVPNGGLPNFAEVAPGIYRGAAPTPEGWARLHQMGIRTEIDLRIEKRGRAEAEAEAAHYGISRIHLPLGREAPTKKQVATFLAALDNPAQRPVFIHCQHGADRTGAMVGIYRVTRQGWSFDRTYTEMRHYGFKPFLSELKGAVRTRASQ